MESTSWISKASRLCLPVSALHCSVHQARRASAAARNTQGRCHASAAAAQRSCSHLGAGPMPSQKSGKPAHASWESAHRRRQQTFTTVASASQQQDVRSFTQEGGKVGTSSGRDPDAVQFEIHKIAGDGSCLFRALAQGFHHARTGALLSGQALLRAGYEMRQDVCAEMVRRREQLEPFITGLLDAYVANMALEGIWGGEPELAVAVHCLQRPVVVYKEVQSGLFGRDLERLSVYGADDYPGVSPVCLLFSGCHYDVLLQIV